MELLLQMRLDTFSGKLQLQRTNRVKRFKSRAKSSGPLVRDTDNKAEKIIQISQGNQNISSVFPPVFALSCEILTTFTFPSSYALLKCKLY